MDITPRIPQGSKVITGYGEGGFKLNHEFIEGSLLLFSDRCVAWDVTEPGMLTLESLTPVLEAGGVELLLLGTGSGIAFPDPAIRQALKSRNIGLDAMDTGAACRTYNVLLMEGRRVAAALIAV